MLSEIHFTNDGIYLVSWKSNPISVHIFGGMEFLGKDLVNYEVISKKEPNISYAYLEISEDMETGVLFDKEPMYNFHLKGYESDGFKIKLKVRIHKGADLQIPQTRLITLRVKK